jgi:hypothetical protein
VLERRIIGAHRFPRADQAALFLNSKEQAANQLCRTGSRVLPE